MNRISQYYASDDLFQATEHTDILAFDGRNFDPSLPLQFNQHRHYDPTPGVWLSEAPVGYAGDGENVRKYAGRVSPAQNNPISDDTDLPTGP